MDKLLKRLEKWPLLDRIFDVSITLKGLDGLLEVAGGVLLLFLTPARLDWLLRTFTEHELSQDPHDFIATHLLHYAHMLDGKTTLFLAAYLLSHGAIKIVLVVALLKQKLWAYPWAIAFLVIFILYQIYRMAIHMSVGLLLLTIFDIFVVFLTVLEYQKHKMLARAAQPSE